MYRLLFILLLFVLTIIYAESINFVGDMMFGRRYYCTNANSYDNDNQFIEDNLCDMPDNLCDGAGTFGIIPNCGTYILLNGIKDYLTQDTLAVNVGNLESMITNDTSTPHPGHETCKIVFHSCPIIVEEIVDAGFKFVNIANNHVLDYMENGLMETQLLLNESNISFSGAGLYDIPACNPSFLYTNEANLAFLGSSDINGEDSGDECEPLLGATDGTPGFCSMNEENISTQLSLLTEYSDSTIIIYQMHTGFEYDSEPEERNFEEGNNIEYYNPFNLEPSERSIAMAHHAVDQGADIVVQHHPHVLQALELYNNTLIAHSLGNFIFDQNFPETWSSIILNAEYDSDGFYNYKVIPIYLQYYLPHIADGTLANYILDYLAMKSRKLDTFIKVDRNNFEAEIISYEPNFPFSTNHTISSFSNQSDQNISSPIKLNKFRHITGISSDDDLEFRVGREIIWMGDFDYNPTIDECVNDNTYYWNLLSSEITTSDFYNGGNSLKMIRNSNNVDNALVDNYYCYPLEPDVSKVTVRGFIKTENAEDAMIGVRFYSSRCNGIISTEYTEEIDGTNSWTEYYRNIDVPEDAKYIDIRMVSFPPDSGESKVWFDNIGLIAWEEWQMTGSEILSPNDYYYYQIKSVFDTVNLTLNELSYYNENQNLSGDINLDGLINILDIVLTIDLILIDEYDETADVNEDNELNILDIVTIINIILN